jgi:cardiolipin synthase
MNKTTPSARPSHLVALPNLLTYLRIGLVPVMIGCFFLEEQLTAHIVALVIFSFASITDFFDGMIARQQKIVSTFGQMLDPIADKLLVSTTLLLLVAWQVITDWALFAAMVILCREILVSGLREHLANLKVSIPVSIFTKWKTFIQILALGFLIGAPIGPHIHLPSEEIGLVLLWLAAGLTLWTGFDYFRNSIKFFAK